MKTSIVSSRFLSAATNQLWSSFLHEATGKMNLLDLFEEPTGS